MTPSHAYRTKIEVLRDFLRAAREPVPKTRIIGAANLNLLSFRRYLRFCTESGLITTAPGGYVVTPRAAGLLEAIEGLITKTFELEQAVHVFEQSAEPSSRPDGHSAEALRYVSRQAWGELLLDAKAAASAGRSGGFAIKTAPTAPTRTRGGRPRASEAKPPTPPDPSADLRTVRSVPRVGKRRRGATSRPRSGR